LYETKIYEVLSNEQARRGTFWVSNWGSSLTPRCGKGFSSNKSPKYCTNAIENYFKPLKIENLTEIIKKYCSENWWIIEFENRYLKFDKIEKASR